MKELVKRLIGSGRRIKGGYEGVELITVKRKIRLTRLNVVSLLKSRAQHKL